MYTVSTAEKSFKISLLKTNNRRYSDWYPTVWDLGALEDMQLVIYHFKGSERDCSILQKEKI